MPLRCVQFLIITLFCITPDGFTHQEVGAATHSLLLPYLLSGSSLQEVKLFWR